jgi:hypothetical protein
MGDPLRTPQQKLLLIELASRADLDLQSGGELGRVVTIFELARSTLLPPKRVTRVIAELEKLGLLDVWYVPGRCNVYVLRTPDYEEIRDEP